MLNTYRTNYTTINELLASPLTATPSAVRRVEPFTPPVVYNWSLGVQRDVGFNLIADAAYVGNAARNQQVTVDINGRPVRLRLSAVEPRSDRWSSADRRSRLPTTSCGPTRASGASRSVEFVGVRRLSRPAVLGESAAIVRWAVGRRRLHLPALEQEPRRDRSVRRRQSRQELHLERATAARPRAQLLVRRART